MQLVVFVLLLLVACEAPEDPPRVLAYSRTLGFRHAEAIEEARGVLATRLALHDVQLDWSEDPAEFEAETLERYRAVAFVYTSGNDILDGDGKEAFETFILRGGGWLGLHSASDTEYEWPFYQQLVVSAFGSHPAVQAATLTVEEREHPAMARIPVGPWHVEDEWYNFRSSPRTTAGVQILATIDEATYSGGTMGADHPMIWSHTLSGGRALYSALGHVPALWSDPAFVDHVVDGVRWVARTTD